MEFLNSWVQRDQLGAVAKSHQGINTSCTAREWPPLHLLLLWLMARTMSLLRTTASDWRRPDPKLVWFWLDSRLFWRLQQLEPAICQLWVFSWTHHQSPSSYESKADPHLVWKTFFSACARMVWSPGCLPTPKLWNRTSSQVCVGQSLDHPHQLSVALTSNWGAASFATLV